MSKSQDKTGAEEPIFTPPEVDLQTGPAQAAADEATAVPHVAHDAPLRTSFAHGAPQRRPSSLGDNSGKKRPVTGEAGAPLSSPLVPNAAREAVVPDGIGDDDDDDDGISLDSYGIPAYKPRYPYAAGTQGDLSVPWNKRNTGRRNNCTFFDFLRVPLFWRQFEFAARITAFAVLIPAALIAANLPHSPFVSTFMPISASVLAAKRTPGEAVAYIFTWIRAGCFWLPLAVIGGALHLGEHMAGWCVYYTAMLFIMATFTEAMVRRICLLLFNSCMVGLLVVPSRNETYACRVMVDWCIGTGLCTVAAFFPYPIFCKKEAQRVLVDIAKNTGTAFRGLVYSFWSPSNVERNMAMSKVRLMTESMDELLPLFEHHQSFSFYEFFFESQEVREIRDVKFNFFERLRVNLSSMTRVLDMVETNPSAIDESDRSAGFGELLNPHLNNVAESFDELMDLFAHAKTKEALLNLRPKVTEFRDRTEDLQDAYKMARRMLFYEHTSDTLEEFVPLMTFYLFTVVCFRDTVDIFHAKVNEFKPSMRTTFTEIFKKTAWTPLMDNIHFLQTLFARWNRREIQRVVEAAKVSGAMILTIGFSYLIDIDKASFSGPNIIAFVSGSNPVEAVQESIVRLTGCLIGTVLGFFAGTYSETSVQRVASLCTLMFCGTFLRFDKEYGVMAVYGMFVLIPLDTVNETTLEDTVARMNQNTFGIFIYLFVSALIFPLSPSLILRLKRINVLHRMSEVIGDMMDLMATPLANKLRGYSDRTVAIPLTGSGSSEEPAATSAETGGIQLSNRSIFMLKQSDMAMEQLDSKIKDVARRLKGTKEVMKFAKDERTLIEVDYPVKPCEQTYFHMYRMTMLLKTMWMCWNVLRSQPSYTAETEHMFQNLMPVAHDVAKAFQRFTSLMAYMMRDPAINLEGDIMKAVLDLSEATTELHTRKSQIMLMLINLSVQQFRNDLDGSASGDMPNDLAKPIPSAPSQSFHPIDTQPSVLSPDYHDRSRISSRVPSTIVRNNSAVRRAATFDANLCAANTFTPVMSPNTVASGGYNFRVMASEKNVSVSPYLHRMVKSMSEHSLHGPVRLPQNFQFPVTSEDAEGMHSFTLCLEMFSNEAKALMMSIGAMLDRLRAKM